MEKNDWNSFLDDESTENMALGRKIPVSGLWQLLFLRFFLNEATASKTVQWTVSTYIFETKYMIWHMTWWINIKKTKYVGSIRLPIMPKKSYAACEMIAKTDPHWHTRLYAGGESDHYRYTASHDHKIGERHLARHHENPRSSEVKRNVMKKVESG
jgi:hypothetical protein